MLVLEDDAQLASGINATTVRALLEYLGRPDGGSHQTNWDILLLGTHPESIILPEEVGAVPRALGGPLLRVGDPFFGLFAYIVRDGAAAKRIVDRVFPCDVQLDSAISDAASEGALNVLHVASPLFTSPKSMPGETDIQRMDEDSFVSMQKVKLVEQGQIVQLPPTILSKQIRRVSSQLWVLTTRELRCVRVYCSLHVRCGYCMR